MPLAQSVRQTNVMQGKWRNAGGWRLCCRNTFWLYLLLITFDRRCTVNKELLSLLSSGSRREPSRSALVQRENAKSDTRWCNTDVFLVFSLSQHPVTKTQTTYTLRQCIPVCIHIFILDHCCRDLYETLNRAKSFLLRPPFRLINSKTSPWPTSAEKWAK